jgi:hypothetical protein
MLKYIRSANNQTEHEISNVVSAPFITNEPESLTNLLKATKIYLEAIAPSSVVMEMLSRLHDGLEDGGIEI